MESWGSVIGVSKAFGSKIYVDREKNSDYHQRLAHVVPEILVADDAAPSTRFHVLPFPWLSERATEILAQARAARQLEPLIIMPSSQWSHLPWPSMESRGRISALTGDKVDELLETVMLVAELQELKANPHRNAKGTVIEAWLDKAKGPLATLKNSLHVIGLNSVPLAGVEFEVVDNLDVARERANGRAKALRIERISAKAGEGKVGIDTHELNVILKVDFQGSIEAIRQAIQALPQENVSLRFLLQGPGDVSVSDVDLAVASEGIIFGFNVRAPGSVKNYAKKKGVEIQMYKVIYDLIDDLRKAMEGLLEPAEEEVPIGSAKVRAVFSSGSGKVAGCMITTGEVVQDCNVRVLRKGKEVYVGSLDSLRRVKETVKQVGARLECGIGVDDFDEWEEGDIIEAFNTVNKARTLEEASATLTAALKDAGVQL
ncbi:Translation initiation factor IF-2, chloroplastic [Zea mays]|uniref:Translation initiation factor IF-2, chloroplastic n=1 Tax=Zea mays TaxID=4577 RepID=A0A3L6EE08_MAIZE|nr:Translation initiation factor IF-2, chloroplastic [Zea mays]